MLLHLFFNAATLALCVAGAFKFDPLKHLAGTTPPNDSDASSSLDPSPPLGCNVSRAAYLVRHGAIHSNDYEFEHYIEPFLAKLTYISIDWSTIPSLAFLSTWRNPILSKDQEMLSRTGKLQAMTLGVELAQRYYYLRTPRKIWSSSSDRTIRTAKYFSRGLAQDDNQVKIINIDEGKMQGANSLTPYDSCPAYSRSTGSDLSSKFFEQHTRPIVTRFNKMAPSFHFKPSDVYAMFLICGYETVLRGSSPFCNLSVFSANEWLGFEYSNDIRYFYNSGYGSPISGAMGYPWVNATFQTLMLDHHSKNDRAADQDLLISFTHRQLPPMVSVALGIFNNSAFSDSNKVSSTMPIHTINHQRVWKSSQIVPFMTDIGIEKLQCDSHGFEKGVYYRVLVNNNPQSVPGCYDGPSESCKESSVVKWLAERAEIVGDFDTVCKVNYTNSTNILSIYD